LIRILGIERLPEGLHGCMGGEEREKERVVKIVVEVKRKSRPAASGGWGDGGARV